MRRLMKVVKTTRKDGSVRYLMSAEEMLSTIDAENPYISAVSCTVTATVDDSEFLKIAEVVEK